MIFQKRGSDRRSRCSLAATEVRTNFECGSSPRLGSHDRCWSSLGLAEVAKSCLLTETCFRIATCQMVVADRRSSSTKMQIPFVSVMSSHRSWRVSPSIPSSHCCESPQPCSRPSSCLAFRGAFAALRAHQPETENAQRLSRNRGPQDTANARILSRSYLRQIRACCSQHRF